MKHKKTLFLIPDGVGIRNYLYSDVINFIKQESKIAFWSPLPKVAFEEVQKIHNIEIEYNYLKLNTESVLTRLFKESSAYARLLRNSKKVNNPTILNNWKKDNKNFKLRQLYFMAELIGKWACKKDKRILNLEHKAQIFWKRDIINSYKNDLKELNPTSVFIPHQRVAALMPICIAAKELNIPVITAIYSWDNLPKARLAVQADKYIVWSDYMKEEMLLYYPEIPQSDVIVTGTPQFEFYFKASLFETRVAFATKYGLDASKKWICFSGDDKKTSPNDPLYLKDVAKAIKSDTGLNNVQLIFRRSPVDFSDRYDEVLQEFEETVSINPLWHTSETDWTSYFPKFEDVSLLANLSFHCDLVINIGSTMAHDFAILNKPCLYLNYNQNVNLDWKTEVVYNFQHFRTMQGIEAVGWLNSPNEIADKIHLALTHPEQVGKDRKKWLEKIAQHPLEDSSRKIANSILC